MISLIQEVTVIYVRFRVQHVHCFWVFYCSNSHCYLLCDVLCNSVLKTWCKYHTVTWDLIQLDKFPLLPYQYNLIGIVTTPDKLPTAVHLHLCVTI